MTPTFEELHTGTDHERVVRARDAGAGYDAIIAVHSTAAGRAVGGTRVWRYDSFDAALTDALRLSRGMTFKCLMAHVPMGGGKSVILRGPEPIDRVKLFEAHGEAIEALGGIYSTGEDVGTTPADMAIVARRTRYVAGLPDKGGAPSPYTARGVIAALDACAHDRWGSTSLEEKVVAIQGCGAVGAPLARGLAARGARLILCDVDAARARCLADELHAELSEPERIWDAPADIFSPCALGGVLNESSIPRLKCSIIAGSANNQLATPDDGARLFKRGIRYAVDYVANAGGLLSGCREMLGWSERQVEDGLAKIGETMRELLAAARRAEIPESEAADRLALERFRALRP